LSNNEDISVIKSKHASLGVQYNRKGWFISTEGYYKVVNGITARSQGFRNMYEFKKAVGSYKEKGVELLVNKSFNRLSAWMSYAYANNKYAFDTFEQKTFLNNIDLKHSLTIGGGYSLKGLKVSAGLN